MSTNSRKRKGVASPSDAAGGPTAKKPRATKQTKGKKAAQAECAPVWPEYFNSVCLVYDCLQD